MKKIVRFSKAQSFILIAILTVQSIEPANPDLTWWLKKYFKSLQRGVTCIVNRKPCAPEDKDAVWAAGTILALLGVILSARIEYAHRQKIARFFSKPQEENTKLSSQEVPPARVVHEYTEKRKYLPTQKDLEEFAPSVAAEELLWALREDNFVEAEAWLEQGASLHDLPDDEWQEEKDRVLQKLRSSHPILVERVVHPSQKKISASVTTKMATWLGVDKNHYLLEKDSNLKKGVTENNLRKVKKAIEAGANVNELQVQGPPILYDTLSQEAYRQDGDLSIAKELMKAGADPDIFFRGNTTIREVFPEKIKKLEEELNQ